MRRGSDKYCAPVGFLMGLTLGNQNGRVRKKNGTSNTATIFFAYLPSRFHMVSSCLHPGTHGHAMVRFPHALRHALQGSSQNWLWKWFMQLGPGSQSNMEGSCYGGSPKPWIVVAIVK